VFRSRISYSPTLFLALHVWRLHRRVPPQPKQRRVATISQQTWPDDQVFTAARRCRRFVFITASSTSRGWKAKEIASVGAKVQVSRAGRRRPPARFSADCWRERRGAPLGQGRLSASSRVDTGAGGRRATDGGWIMASRSETNWVSAAWRADGQPIRCGTWWPRLYDTGEPAVDRAGPGRAETATTATIQPRDRNRYSNDLAATTRRFGICRLQTFGSRCCAKTMLIGPSAPDCGRKCRLLCDEYRMNDVQYM